MNLIPQRNDDSRRSDSPSVQPNEPAQAHSIQETVMLTNGHNSLSAASHVDDWRELARRIEQEPDASKIVNLVQQLIAKFDEQNSRGR